jgi:hypothetical protein
MWRALSTVLFVGLISSSAAGDVLPRGHKGVSVATYLLGLDKFPEYKFFLYPTSMSGGLAAVTPGKPLPSRYKFADTRLYAVKASSLPAKPDDRSPRSAQSIGSGGGSVPMTDPTETINIYYRVTGIEGTSIKLELVKQELFDRAGKPIKPAKPVGDALMILSSLGVAALVLTRLRRP